MKRALITGVDGQDGSYLAELLVEKGYQVVGWIPQGIPVNHANLSRIQDKISLVEGSLMDEAGLVNCLEEHQPHEIYNLASPSSPIASWNAPVAVGDAAGLGVARLLQAVRNVVPQARFYQASSSEMFGIPPESPQSETTPFQPRNPYGISKVFAHWMTVRFREYHGLYAVSGILFNHESPRRSLDFVTRKITHGAVRIKMGLETHLPLGDLDARRDWGFAGDYVQAIWMMLQQDTPDDFVIGTGETHSVREFCEQAFGYLNLDYRDHVVQDPNFIRKPETIQLVANPQKARRQLGWQPQVTFSQLVQLMVDEDLRACGLTLPPR